MGNDGGTIVRRADIVRVREEGGKANVDPAVLARVLATTCALSRQSLRTPIVSDALGRLYNKDSVVKYLLQRAEGVARANDKDKAAAGRSRDSVAGHLRGLKDVQSVNLTPNPAYQSVDQSSNDDLDAPAPFICPLNQRELNGRHRFVYLKRCGCVMSESGLRATVADDVNGKKAKVGEADADRGKASCPVCGTDLSADCLGKKQVMPGGDVVVLNGTEAEVGALRMHMEQTREAEQARKKEAKAAKAALAAAQKGSKGGDVAPTDEVEAKQQQRDEKRKRKEEAMRMFEEEQARDAKRFKVMNGADPRTVSKTGMVVEQAKLQSNTGKEMSAAMRSIYGMDKPKGQDSWMTRGTFNRFA